VLALNPSDGKIKWGYQYTPNDPYDYDEISEHPIINAKGNLKNIEGARGDCIWSGRWAARNLQKT
jgi:alcohol dehydrogenase (cytochrome c)